MPSPTSANPTTLRAVEKCPTGIAGFDDITTGGLPRGRTTLVCGDPGCGKTLFGLEFLLRGATEFGERGVFMAFEETPDDLAKNVASLGFDLPSMVRDGKIAVDYVHIERSEIEDSGEYDLEGLFLRLDHAIRSVGAKRVVLDTVEALFGGLANHTILRAELRRLFRWLKDRGVTAVITGERGDKSLTRQGLEEYVSDCVILLDHRVTDQVSTRRLRVVKYRGSTHGTNEYPFLIDEEGISVLPVTSLGLAHDVAEERLPTGVDSLDAMLGGGGFYRGTSVLVTGTAGSGKTTLAAQMANAACGRGERVLYFAFEESPRQIVRNMRSVGIRLDGWEERGLLRFVAQRPTEAGLELHLARMHKAVDKADPSMVVVDPISAFTAGTTDPAIRSMLLRLVDFLKSKGITAVYTSLTRDTGLPEHTDENVSSLMDAWLLLRNQETQGERNRTLYVLKARGLAHSNQVREFLLTSDGIVLREPYVGPGGVYTGSARQAQEARDRASRAQAIEALERSERELERKRLLVEAQVEALRAGYEAEAQEARAALRREQQAIAQAEEERQAMAARRDGAAASGVPAAEEVLAVDARREASPQAAQGGQRQPRAPGQRDPQGGR